MGRTKQSKNKPPSLTMKEANEIMLRAIQLYLSLKSESVAYKEQLRLYNALQKIANSYSTDPDWDRRLGQEKKP